jgi:bloom syndrome protein
MNSLIDQDDKLEPESKQRQKDSINEVVRYCQNKTDCRRSQVLAFFNETFDPAKCLGGCDVCLNENVFVHEDVSEDALSVIRMMQDFAANAKITVIVATEVWRGQSNKNTHNYMGNKYYGAGKGWDRQDAERLIQTMQMEKALALWTYARPGTWSQSYLMVSGSFPAEV